jgi:hypothetical protein
MKEDKGKELPPFSQIWRCPPIRAVMPNVPPNPARPRKPLLRPFTPGLGGAAAFNAARAARSWRLAQRQPCRSWRGRIREVGA